MGSSALPLLLLLIPILHSGLAGGGSGIVKRWDLPRPALTVTPDSVVWTRETVELKCVIESNHSDWTYEWYKDTNCEKLQLSEGPTVNRDTLTIRRAAVSDEGQYWCKGVTGWVSIQSSSVSLSVKALPRPTVTVTPVSPVSTGETVELKCVFESDHSDWTYEWYKDGNSVLQWSDGHYTVNRDTLTIRRAAESDQGHYWCEGLIRSVSTQSYAVSLSVKALPTPTVTVTPDSAVLTAESSQSSSNVSLSEMDLKPTSKLRSELGSNATDLKPTSELRSELGSNATDSTSSSSSSSLSSSSSSPPPLLVIGVSVGLSVFLLLLILLVLLLRHKKKGLYHVYDDVIKADNRDKGQSSLETLYVLN